MAVVHQCMKLISSAFILAACWVPSVSADQEDAPAIKGPTQGAICSNECRNFASCSGNLCDGGTNNGQACTDNTDCPEGCEDVSLAWYDSEGILLATTGLVDLDPREVIHLTTESAEPLLFCDGEGEGLDEVVVTLFRRSSGNVEAMSNDG